MYPADGRVRALPTIPRRKKTMIRKRVLAVIANAAAIVAAAAVLATPVANADTLGDMRGAVNGARAQSTCGPLNYSGQLEGAAQAWVRDARALDDVNRSFSLQKNDYPGDVRWTRIASGDPTDTAVNSMIAGARDGINDCGAVDFGVGMVRDDVIDKSFVAVVLGAPKPVVEAPKEPVKCQAGSPDGDSVPFGQTCRPSPPVPCPADSPVTEVPFGQTCPVAEAQTNKIQAAFGEPGLTSVDFTVTNTATLNATCDYVSTTDSINPLVPKKTTRSISVPAGQSTTTTFDGAPTLSTFNVTLTCKDTSGKQKEPLGTVTTSLQW
jgi:hypothetical protein